VNQHIRVQRALQQSLRDSGVSGLLKVRDRDLVELIPQSEKLVVVSLGHSAQFSAGLPPSAHEADGIGAARG